MMDGRLSPPRVKLDEEEEEEFLTDLSTSIIAE
jgi:hypothetical protein